MKTSFLSLFLLFTLNSCQAQTDNVTAPEIPNQDTTQEDTSQALQTFDSTAKTIHLIVALCDNKYQGIVPVPASIGNGQDPKNNLYWGCAYGVKTYFKKSPEWTLVQDSELDSVILQQLVFRHKKKNVYLIADAYNGKFIKQATQKFMSYSAGMQKEVLPLDDKNIGIGGHSDLIAYIGHDGLMDFTLDENYKNTDNKSRDAIILACYSKHYFQPHLQEAQVNPILWTSGLMAPEAYTLHDALTGYVLGETNEQIQLRAAKAYSKYQKCSLSAAKNLLVTH